MDSKASKWSVLSEINTKLKFPQSYLVFHKRKTNRNIFPTEFKHENSIRPWLDLLYGQEQNDQNNEIFNVEKYLYQVESKFTVPLVLFTENPLLSSYSMLWSLTQWRVV